MVNMIGLWRKVKEEKWKGSDTNKLLCTFIRRLEKTMANHS